MQMHSTEQRWEWVFRLRRNRPALQKNRCEIRSTSRASPRSAQDDARERAPYISAAFLSVEHPVVFAVLFEAAKAKFPQCNSRVLPPNAFGNQGVFLKKDPLEPQKLLEKFITKVVASAVIPHRFQRIHGAPAPFERD